MDRSPPAYFDYLAVAKECRLRPDVLEALEAVERREFPDDQMMFELHMLRLLEQLRAGRVKIEELLRHPE